MLANLIEFLAYPIRTMLKWVGEPDNYLAEMMIRNKEYYYVRKEAEK